MSLRFEACSGSVLRSRLTGGGHTGALVVGRGVCLGLLRSQLPTSLSFLGMCCRLILGGHT